MKNKHMTILAVLMLAGCCIQPILHAEDAKKAPEPSLDMRVKKALDEGKLKYDLNKDLDFKLVFKSKRDNEPERTQLVIINSNTEKMGPSGEIREVYSVALKSTKPLSAEIANKLLEQNKRYKIGAWQVSHEGDNYFVVFCARIPADCPAADLEVVTRMVSNAADTMERELTDKDEF